jgi:hypothetical protein
MSYDDLEPGLDGPDDGGIFGDQGDVHQRLMGVGDGMGGMGGGPPLPSASAPSLMQQHSLGSDTVLRVQRRDEHDGRIKDLGTFPATLNSDALVRRLGRPGSYILTPVNGIGQRAGTPISFDVDPAHEALRSLPTVAESAAGGGASLGEVQQLVAATMAPLLQQLQQREARLDAHERRLLEQQSKLEDARVATLTLANDAQINAADKAMDAATARMQEQQQSFAQTMMALQEASEQRHQQAMEQQKAANDVLLTRIMAINDADQQRAKDWMAIQQQALQQQQEILASNNQMMMARWDNERASEKERMEREDTRRQQQAASDLERQREHSRTVLALREQQAEAASGMGSLERLVELKKVMDQLGGGEAGEKPLISQIVDGLKEVAGLGTELVKASNAANDAEVGIEEEMAREQALHQQAQQEQMLRQQALMQQQAALQQQAQAQPPQHTPLALPPPDPFDEFNATELATADQQPASVAVAATAAAAADPFAPAAQPALPVQQAQPAADPFAPSAPSTALAAPAVAPPAAASRLPAQTLATARAAFRWAAGQILAQPPGEWQTIITGALAQAHSAIVPYVQEVGVTQALGEAGLPPQITAQVIAGMQQNPLLASALESNYNMTVAQLRWH